MVRRAWLPLVMIFVTLVSAWLTATRLRISSDLSALFPDRAASAALGRFVRAFGGGDVAAVLVRGKAASDVEAAASDLVDVLRTSPAIAYVMDRAPAPTQTDVDNLDPRLAWRYAGPAARAALEHALTPEGMQQRLDGTRTLLLAPGSAPMEDWLARDPLRLAAVPWEGRAEFAAGVTAAGDGAFVGDGGRARLVVLSPRGSAFDGAASAAFVAEVEAAFARVRPLHPDVTLALTGGHAIAHATQTMLVRDLAVSGILSLALACATFVLTFRRVRALLAVVPPLIVGTLWTTGAAALFYGPASKTGTPGGLSAIAIAFTAVVVGVGVDTGVHVYAALLQARRRGLSPQDAARAARAATARPTLLAALAAGFAFASLALSELSALRQLGILCGVGEVLTAAAIVLATPELGAYLERGPPPAALAPRWLTGVRALTATPGRARVALAVSLAPVVLLAIVGWPKAANAIVAVRPRALEPLAVQDEVYRIFGGRPGQWIVLSIDTDGDRASARADRVAEALEPLAQAGDIDGFDSLAPYAPAEATVRARLLARDALDLPGRRASLARALASSGFDLAACAPALAAFEHPDAVARSASRPPTDGPLAWLVRRHRARDGLETLAATYVRPSRAHQESDARVLAAIRAADPSAIVTGYPYLEGELEDALARDLPRVALVAVVLVILALRAVLGRGRDVLLALATIGVEISCVLLSMRILHLRWHIYDALVLPVLVGVTIDESMFLLHAARDGSSDRVDAAIFAQGPLVASTALTTAAGFGALLVCKFDGLFDLGAVGTLGVLLGLASALVIVPAGLRLAK